MTFDFLARGAKPGDDPIFALNAEASARKARGEPIVNATIGALLADDGALAVLPTAARAVGEVPTSEWAPYAPISGSPAFLDAVLDDALGAVPELRAVGVAVATPGGTGALRHALTTFLAPGQSVLTTSFYWGPYATLADEHDRRVATFRMFDEQGALDVADLDRALGEAIAAQGRALLFLNDPCHNPTGYSMSDADWAATVEVVGRHAERAPVAVLVDAAYAAYGPAGALARPTRALARIADRALVLVAWSASKTFTHYGLRVGALVACVPDPAARAQVAGALGYACRGTWSNCNRGGMAAVTALLRDAALRTAVDGERASFVALLDARVAAWNAAARPRGLRYPRYDGGFFVTVFTDDAQRAAEALRGEGVFVVPQRGALRVALCSVAARDVPRLVEAIARHVV